MGTNLNLSVGEEPRIHVEFQGWADRDKDKLVSAIQGIAGVTRVDRAGGNISAYAYFDPEQTTSASIEKSVSALAEQITSPAGALLYGGENATLFPNLNLIKTVPTEEIIVPFSGSGVEPMSDSSVVDMLVPVQTTISSSAWTGRKSKEEQIRAVKTLAPLALIALSELEKAIEDKRFNDQASSDALETLRELHSFLGDLIVSVETDHISADQWVKFEQCKERAFAALRSATKLLLVAPGAAVGAATMLSLISGLPVTETMLLAVYGSAVLGDSLGKGKKSA